ncbi:MAG: PBP1A family penicillin-binding protein [Myxococcota bacterium]|nr:PBP1A family penicillin-binding protein [Myxococcota bacterium]
MAARETGRKKAARKKAAGKKAAGKKAAGRKTAAKKSAARGTAVRKAGARKGLRRKSGGGGEGPRRPGPLTWFVRVLVVAAFGFGVWTSSWLISLDRIVVGRFEGQRFVVPSRVYSAPGILYPGLDAELIDLRGTLARAGYREQTSTTGRALHPGLFRWSGNRLRVYLRAFDHPTRPEPARDIVIRFEGNTIAEIRELPRSREVGAVLLEPELVGAYFGNDREQRELVEIDRVPQHLVDAVLAVEDRRFVTHHGVDPTRILGAVVANLRAGGVTQGGSTLTQQLVKNFFLTPERTLRRKATEAVMALIVEARYSKREILQSYLNEIYLGRRGSTSVHGVGEAARYYFGKSVSELVPAESALLAAIIQSPNRLSPHRNPEQARERRDLVLELMRRQNRLDLAAFNHARATALDVAAPISDAGEARYFLDFLRRQLPEAYDRELLQTEGLHIYSTLDSRLQRAAMRALRGGLESIETNNPQLIAEDSNARLQGCLIAMRPQTGEIVALVGGRSYGTSQFDRCTQARRAAGSVFKPFIYLAALEAQGGAPTATMASFLDDSPLEIETRDGLWTPQNYDHEFRGRVALRTAIERSLNVPSVRLALDVGIDRVADMARRMGVKSRLPQVPSLALGTAEVSPLEIARAYSTLASGGIRPTPHTFEDVTAGDRTLEQRQLELEQALDPGLAYLGVSLLEGVVERGTAQRLRWMGLQGAIAGKTGTTDDERDLWFVGFTPELVAVVWLGFDEPRSIAGVSSSTGPLPIWASFMQEAVGNQMRGMFIPPRGIERFDIDPESGALALSGCPERKSEVFLSGTTPQEICDGKGLRAYAGSDREERIRRARERQQKKRRRESAPGLFGWIRDLL